jgi:hypothetical protein
VEGWHTGKEWIDTGILVERVNFAASQVSDIDKPGVRALIDRLRSMGELSPEALIDALLDQIGPLDVSSATHGALVNFAQNGGPLNLQTDGRAGEERIGEILQLIVATREFQLV